MKISYSFGMADLIHFGHIRAFEQAKKGADLHIFGLVSDSASDAWFGRHVSNEEERTEVLKSIKSIDRIMQQNDFNPLENLKTIHSKYPNAILTLFHGNEWGILSAKEYVESIGGSAVKLDYYEKLSPQRILDVLSKSDIRVSPINNEIISTKANTLLALKGLVKKSYIEDLLILEVGEYLSNPNLFAQKISTQFKGNPIVVRSSSKREDAFEESNAGHFTSVLNVNSSDAENVKMAINSVIASYGDKISNDEQVLIQKQTDGVSISGVVFTRDIQRNRPYYAINYDISGSTDSVTSGSCGKMAWISYSARQNDLPDKWRPLMQAVWELERLLPDILLDIEFALTKNKVVIFQVRPLAAAYKFGPAKTDLAILESATKAKQRYEETGLEGYRSYSDMAFWNPAEIIGENPKFLDYCLYREIITKRAWNEGLIPMGYRTIPGELMYKFGNKPYINLEKSFEALMPSEISTELAEKLRNYYIRKLKSDLSSHDKIEFEISHNCFDFSLPKKLRPLLNCGFSKAEIEELERALRSLTIKNIQSYGDCLSKDLLDLKELESVRLDASKCLTGMTSNRILAKYIKVLLEAVTRLGTPQFSRHARCAFIAKSICRSLVSEGYLSLGDYNNFLSGIETVAVDYESDYRKAVRGELSKDAFLSRYGHLRAGTYNISSLRYDQIADLFLGDEGLPKQTKDVPSKQTDLQVKAALNAALSKQDLGGICAESIIWFIKESTKEREFFKFIFTKSLSLAIEIIKTMGASIGFESKDLAYLELPEIYAAEYYADNNKLKEFWGLVIEKRKEIYKSNSSLILSSVIMDKKDFEFIGTLNSRPNFITEKVVTGEVCLLNDDNAIVNIDNKIVVIEKADPGFDWIFSKKIAGLITKYGGAASHMAIRCAEFGVAAAIGCGSSLFDYASKSRIVTVDCKHELIKRGR